MIKTNFYFLLPSFHDQNGHENAYISSFNKFVNCKKYKVKFLICKNNLLELPFFADRVFEKQYSLIQKITGIFKTTRVLLKQNFYEKFSIIYLDGYSLYFLFALSLSLVKKNNCKILIFCRYKYNQPLKIIFKFLIFLIRKLSKEVCLITDNEINFKFYKKNEVAKVYFFPTPFFKKLKKKKKIKKKINTILLPGQYRAEKYGNNLINFLNFNRNKKINIIAAKKIYLPFKNNFFFQTIPNNCNIKNYNTYFDKSDIVILPYDRKEYLFRTSGVFFESIEHEKIVFLSSDIWISKLCLKYKLKELIVQDWANFDLVERYSQLSIKNIMKKIKIMKKKLSLFHNEQKFVNKLIAISDKKK